MAELFALLSGNAPLLYAWRSGDGWQVSETPRGLAAKGRNLAIFVPPVDVAVVRAPLPMKSERDALRAAPFAIEDDLAQSVDEIHVGLGARTEGVIERLVCGVSEDIMSNWVDYLSELGLTEAALIAPQTTLPEGDALVECSEGVFGRIDGRYFALDGSAPADLVQGLVGHGEDVTRYDLGNEPDVLLQQLAAWVDQNPAINLRQGKHAVRRPVDAARFQRWRLAGGLAAALGIAWTGAQFWSAHNMNQLTNTLDQRASEIAVIGWPELDGDVDRALASIRSQGGPSAVLPTVTVSTAALYAALSTIEGSELRSLRYDRQRGQVLAIIAYPEFGDGDRLAAAFDNSGLQARVGDARQSGRQVVAELVLEAGS